MPPTSPAELKSWWAVLVAAGSGLVITIVLVSAGVALASDPSAGLRWDLGDRMSCTTVISAWQSSIFGPPNAVLGAAVFAAFGSAAVASLLGSRPSPPYLLVLWGLSGASMAFATWFSFQSAFMIDSLCLWCPGIVTSVLVISAALTRLATAAHAWGDGRLGTAMARAVRTRVDLAVWATWWLAIAVMLVVGLV